jgi:LacI family transcriptional regulator
MKVRSIMTARDLLPAHAGNLGHDPSGKSRIADTPKVALLVETARSFGREFLSGVARYARHHGPWIFHITPGDFEQAVPKMKQWGGTGIIARIPNERVAQAILETGLPTIAIGLSDEQLRPGHPLAELPEVSPAEDSVVRLVIDHFKERSLRNFAFVGLDDRSWSNRREQAYRRQLAEANIEPHVYRQPRHAAERVWEKEQAVLADWLSRLPTPLGLFACNDDRGRQVLEACQLSGLAVPEDVAVIGVDNDAVFCDLADPPLSSVALNAETAGYRAAELLAGMMAGRPCTAQKILVEALHVVTRQSTDLIAVGDNDVAAALQFIRREQGRSLSVEDVANAVAVSRRYLERRFRAVIGRTVLEEIQFVRLQFAKRLLLETTHPISTVAEMSGFGSVGYFIQFFQERVGTTPRRFRIQMST